MGEVETVRLTKKLRDLIAAAEEVALTQRVSNRVHATTAYSDPSRRPANEARIRAQHRLDSAAVRFGRNKAAKELP